MSKLTELVIESVVTNVPNPLKVNVETMRVESSAIRSVSQCPYRDT